MDIRFKHPPGSSNTQLHIWAQTLIDELRKGYQPLTSYAVLDLPDPTLAKVGMQVFVTDEAGGAVPAFSDGINWRRVTDRAIVS